VLIRVERQARCVGSLILEKASGYPVVVAECDCTRISSGRRIILLKSPLTHTHEDA